MGEPKKLTSHIKQDKKKVAVNSANGGGVGVGIVFIGGALATAALLSVLTVGRRLLKSTNSKNRNHCPSTGSTETPEMFIAEKTGTNDIDESKGVLFIPPDSSPDVHQNLSNGAAQTSTTETDIIPISSKSFFPEEKHILEPYSGKRDVIFDDKEILLSSGLQGSDSSMQCNGFVVKEELSFSTIKDQVLFQKAFKAKMKGEPYGREIEIIGEKNTTEIPDVDHGTEEESKLMQVNDDQKIRDVKCKEAAETAGADHNAALILQSSKERGSTLVDHEDSNGTGCLPSKSCVPVDQYFLVQLHHNSSICKDEKLRSDCKQDSQAFETVETLEGAAPLRTVDVEKGQGHSMILDKVERCGIKAENLQNINKGNDRSELTFFEKYMLELAAQNSQQTHSLKPRILGLTRASLVLSWAFCFWYFGLPFLKISLIVILVILLSKIQGI